MDIATKQAAVERLTVISSRPFEEVVAAFEAALGHPEMNSFRSAITGAKTYAEMERVIQAALGKSGFAQFARFDLGAILRKEGNQEREGGPKIVRFLIGNPLIMKEMVKCVPDAGSYTPATVLIVERAGGVHLSYDTMASFLAPYENGEALEVARKLDVKVEALLREAAA